MCRVCACVGLCFVEKKNLRQLRKRHTVQRTKVELKISKKERGKNQCQKVTWSEVRAYFLAVHVDINTKGP